MKKLLLLFVLMNWLTPMLAPSLPGQAYLDSALVGHPVVSIDISGNRRTRARVIQREMKLKPGQPVRAASLEEDLLRVQNLQLFDRVQVAATAVVDTADFDTLGVDLHYYVDEMWYLFPFPILFINDKDWSKVSWGAGLAHLNFLGGGERLTGSFWLGYNPSVSLSYSDPWIFGQRQLFMSLDVNYQTLRSKHYTQRHVDETFWGVTGGLGKRFGFHTWVKIMAGYQAIRARQADPGYIVDGDEDRIPLAGLLWMWDKRDLKEYPHKGWYISAAAVQYGFSDRGVNLFRHEWDVRGYLPVTSKATLALRSFATLSHGPVPLYKKIYFGYSQRIRGHFFQRFSGDNRFLASAAFRFPLIPVRYLRVHDSPQLANLKFGVSLGLFADSGCIWDRDEEFEIKSMKSGYGLGIHVHLPYIQVLRLEAAWNESGESQLIADLFVDI